MRSKQIVSIIVNIILVLNQTLYAASITVDAVAPSANQATLLNAPNGVPIVNIVTPNAQGLSHNKFTNFNVDPQGLILNNAKTIANTQLAGYISYNPNLTGDNAKLILNEVTGTSKTLLRGYTEVAGVAADVIIANPNGISVNGGGFINTPNATLTTGTPMLSSGVLQGFDISSGNILIEGDGLNTNNIAKVNLYAKALQLNAKLYADGLNVVTGENTIALDGSVTAKNFTGSGVSIDSSALGGIYANTITLKSTDKGIGVNLPPEVFAQTSLTLSADGDIVASKVVADSTLSLTSQSANIHLTNDMSANDVTITAGETLFVSQDKVIKSFQDMTVLAKNINNQGELNALLGTGTNSVVATQAINNEGLIGGYDVEVQASSIDNSGALYAKNNLAVTSQTLNNTGVIRSNKAIDLLVENTLTNQVEGLIYSDDTLTIAANSAKDKINTINNYGTIQSDKNINITAQTLNNTASTPTISQASTSGSTTISQGGINDYDIVTTTTQTQIVDIPTTPALIIASGDIALDLGTLNNHYSLIASDGNIVLNATLANNVGKVIVTTTDIVTAQYRNTKSCKKKFGVTYGCRTYAGYRGTFTQSDTTRIPLAGFGIQAKKSISGNVVTLNNISDQLNGSLDAAQIQAKLTTIDSVENNAKTLQKLTTSLTDSNANAQEMTSDAPTITGAVAAIVTLSDLDTFKTDLASVKTGLQESLDDTKATLSSLESIVTSIKALNTGGVTHDTTSLESTITVLKNNITLAEAHLVDFETIKTSLLVVADATAKKQNLIDTNTALSDLFSQNATTLSALNITPLSTGLETVGNTLRAEVNTALSLQTNVEYKIISNNEGLYQTNTHNALSPTTPVNYTANSNTIIDNITLPKGKYGTFLVNKASNHPYLIEANPLYANYNTFISSDYMLSKLDFRPEKTLKRLGDAMYETQLVSNSVIRLSGDRYLTGYASELSQFQGLMDNALALQSSLNLHVGISLSKEQIARLSKNIVWMVEKVIDGQTVLVPEVYLSTNNITHDGAKIVAGDINLVIQDTLLNDGIIASEGTLKLATGSKLTNQNGTISSKGTMTLTSNGELKNLSGTIQSNSDMNLQANSITSTALTQDKTYTYAQGTQTTTQKGKEAQFISNGNLAMQSNEDITLKNTNVQAKENIALSSTNGAVNVEALETKENYDFRLKNGYNKGNSITQNSSSIEGKNIAINANQVNITASTLDATQSIDVQAKDSINIISANDFVSQEMQIKTKGGLFGGKSTKKDESSKSTVVGSTLGAKNINIDTQALSIQGSKLTAEQAVIASDIIELISLTQSSYENHFSDKSGLITRTIATKGKIKEEVIPAIIQVRDKLIVNSKDITNQLSTDTIVKTLSSQSDLSVEQVKLIKAYAKSDEWDKHMTTLSGMGSIIVAAVVIVCTMGAGSGVVGLGAAQATAASTAATAAATGTLAATTAAASAASALTVATIQAAVVQSMIATAASSLATAAITGNSPVLDASSLVRNAVLAGVLSYGGYTNVGDLGQGELVNKVAQGTVNAGVKTVITGGNFKDNLINEAAQATYTAVGDFSMGQDQGTGGNSNWSEGGINKVILHSAVGAGVAALKGEDVLAGAASGAVAEIARPLSDGASKEVQTATSMLIGGITAGAVGGEKSINVGSYIGQTSDQYNRQLHTDEIDFINKNADKYAEQRKISPEQAKQELAQEALRITDSLWASMLGGSNPEAKAFLTSNLDSLASITKMERDNPLDGLSNIATNQANLDFYRQNIYSGIQQDVATVYNDKAKVIVTTLESLDADKAKEIGSKIAKNVNDYVQKTPMSQMGDDLKDALYSMAEDVASNGKKLTDLMSSDPNEIAKVYNISIKDVETLRGVLQAESIIAIAGMASSGTLKKAVGKEVLEDAGKSVESAVTKDALKTAEKGVYDAKEIRGSLEEVYGKENVTSTTVVNDPLQRVNSNLTKGVEVVTDSYGNKAVKIDYIDSLTEQVVKANIPYDSIRGLPIFDDVAKYTTNINDSLSYNAQMKQATLDLKDAINSGKIDSSKFTSTQLEDILTGSNTIEGYTWHHNAQSAPNNMQLVPQPIHDAVKHIGQGSLSGGK